MKLKVVTQPNLSLTSSEHIQAAKDGEEHFRKWERNVADHLKDKSDEEVQATLRASAHPFAVMFENWIGDFNISTGIRNANGFNAKEVFYIGNRKWDFFFLQKSWENFLRPLCIPRTNWIRL